MKPADPAIRAEALELRKLGWSLERIALSLDISPQIVGRWSKQENLPSRPNAAPKSTICPGCGKRKSLSAKTCMPCRPRSQTPQERQQARLTRYSDAALLECLPIPAPSFPEYLCSPPRTHCHPAEMEP